MNETPLPEEDSAHSEVVEDPKPAGPRVLSVTEITTGIRNILEGTFDDVWVCGEVSNWRPASSGHWYFSLKDANSQLSAVMFRGVNSAVKFKVEQGMELICHGKLSVYPPRGSYQIIIDYCEPKGVGALQLAFEQLKKKLADEGLFDKSKKKPIPYMPRRVGVVTSPTGAAVRDICTVLRRRFPSVDICLVPAKVQGDGSAAEIARAIELLDARGDVDVMIVGRGGGSIEDLWAFNEEVVARAIFAATTPIISAVGHEIDFTIADFVADVRAPTPSAAAEIAVPVRAELLQGIGNIQRRLDQGLRGAITRASERLHHLRQRLRFPTQRITDGLQWVDSLRERLQMAMRRGIGDRRQAVAQWAGQLQHLSPLAVLAKGYAVVQKDGATVRDAAQLKPGDVLDVRLEKGHVETKVI
ncbi:MAG: exodeoxyribonuclease VII large subunit [Deltaproteobacteria bacterium CG11_big_fil_rev_8_21_14_0_20_47_16]|nr:MAG: exodeoxyribonuclease VII large subunit [Deltaproteobacteria bacterium CG11_big_fil_rev_8_21_14_0_20_47_16]